MSGASWRFGVFGLLVGVGSLIWACGQEINQGVMMGVRRNWLAIKGLFVFVSHVLSFNLAQHARTIFPYILARGGGIRCMIITVIFGSGGSNKL